MSLYSVYEYVSLATKIRTYKEKKYRKCQYLCYYEQSLFECATNEADIENTLLLCQQL